MGDCPGLTFSLLAKVFAKGKMFWYQRKPLLKGKCFGTMKETTPINIKGIMKETCRRTQNEQEKNQCRRAQGTIKEKTVPLIWAEIFGRRTTFNEG